MIAAVLNSPFSFGSPPAPPPPTLPEFIGVSAAGSTTIAVPAGTLAGDLMVFFGGSFNGNTIAVPSGWTQHGSTVLYQGGQYSAYLATRIAGGSEPATYTFGTGTARPGFIATYRNATGIDVAGTITALGSSTTMTLTGIASSPGSVLLACLTDRDFGITHTVPSGMTQRLNSVSGMFWQTLLADLADASSANRVFTAASSTFEAAGLLVSIK